MNGMQGTAVGLVIGGGVAAGIVALALGGSDPNLTGGAALTPGAGTAIAPAELEQLKADAARIPELERELEAAKAKAASAAAVEGGAAASAAQVAKLQAEILVLKNERAELQQALAAAKAAAGA
ncbi:MAG: hypothetical protein ACYTGX_04880, partial [Planctomycetota bacterium]